MARAKWPRMIRSNGGDAFAIGADLSDPAAAGRLVDETAARWGVLDVVVNSAGRYGIHF